MDDEKYFQILELMQSVNETLGHLVIGNDQRTMQWNTRQTVNVIWPVIQFLRFQKTWPGH
ncbi:MAG: hypothetical protein CMP20_02660 [Rickettsiales bacterium]|nr:hypothetical protein [Rickettsiales bacterium]